MRKYNYVFSAIFIFFFFFNYTQDLQQRLKTTENELLGLDKLESFDTLNNALQRYRGLYSLHSEPKSDMTSVYQRRQELQQIIQSQLQIVQLPDLKQEMLLIFSKEPEYSSAACREITQIIDELNKQVKHIADKHELLYEPERENFLLMEIIVYDLQELLESSAKLRDVASRIGSDTMTGKDRFQFSNNRYLFKHFFHSLKNTIGMIEQNKRLLNGSTTISTEYQNFSLLLNKIIDGASTHSRLALYNEGTRLVEAVYSLSDMSIELLKINLHDRIKKYSQIIIISYSTFFISVLLTFMVSINFLLRSKKERQLKFIERRNQSLINELQSMLHSSSDLREVCEKSLKFVSNYFSASSGLLYTYNKMNEQLNLKASYGLDSKFIKHSLRIGEGTIGQNVLDARVRESIVEEIAQTSQVDMGAVKARVKKVITFPLINLNHIIGVVQLVLLEDKIVESAFLSQLTTLIASYVDKEEKSQENLKYLAFVDKHVITSSTNKKGIITEASQAFADISGYTKEELIGHRHNLVRHPDMPAELFDDLWETISQGDTWNNEVKNRTKEGDFHWFDATISPDFDFYGNIVGYTAIRQDITDRKKIEEIAITDGLTEIFNRRHFDSVFPLKLREMKREKKSFVFVLLDIDHFKQYNDTYGHQEGDKALTSVALILKQTLKRPRDLVFRLGGEEFGLVFDAENTDVAEVFTETVKDAIEGLKIEHRHNSASPYVTVSMGAVFIPPFSELSSDYLYKIVDDMLYRAKDAGRNKVKMKRIV